MTDADISRNDQNFITQSFSFDQTGRFDGQRLS
jgi:hypothetical protein